jgi:ketosteroid isomerase-like protein
MRVPLCLLAGLLQVGSTSGGASAQSTAGLSDKDRAALRAFADQDAKLVMTRNWDALAAEYAADAVRMPPNEPTVQGREAIRRWLEQLPPITSFSFRLVDLKGHGNLAFLRGAYSIAFIPPGAAPGSDTGKILVVFQKQMDGSWLRVADAWNSDSPPPK